MNEEELKERLTQTTIQDIKGFFLDLKSLKLIDLSIPVYELTPSEAQELNKEGYVLRWIHKSEHNKGEPNLRLYQLIGKNGG